LGASYSEIRQRAARVRRLLSARDFREAERETEEGIALFPDSAELLALAADIQRKMSKPAEAASLLKRAEASDPSHELVVAVGADLAYDRKDFKKASELYRELLDRRATAYYTSRYVLVLNRLRRHEEAAEAARQGLERFPGDLWILRGLASAEAKRGRNEEAVALYEKLVERDPNDRFAYKELMRLRTADAPADEAATALKGLMRSGSRAKNPHLKTLAADRMRKAGRDREAAAEYEAALGMEPGNAYALSQLGFCYRRLGEAEKAIETLGKALLADPSNLYVRKTLESLCRSADRLQHLVDLVDEALKLHPEVKSLYGMRKKVAKGLS
jgi:tetratricopeptide (TPR) repeat protein